MHDPSTESCKPGHPKGHPLEYFDPVITALNISIRIWELKRVEDLFAPVLVSEGYLDEVRQSALLCAEDPFAEPSGRFLPALTCFHQLKLLL